ncbi:hypothetical protein RB653_002726 [Dictyostelium firmibasis]|uniref:Adenylate kinase n=1 Tax=Dictyostelium firmibasis TaxID=79012 RepID=A0AAN7TYB0_9MYCE
MIKGSSIVLKELSSGVIRRGSKDFISNAQRRNSICGPCIGFDSKQSLASTSKILTDDSIGSILENSTSLPDLQLQENFQKPQPFLGRKNSISGIINSIKNEKLKNINPLSIQNSAIANNGMYDINRRFSIDPLSMKTNENYSFQIEKLGKFKSFNLDEKFMELEAESTFSNVWGELVSKYGLENLEFPKEITFLAGAPGSGKGTNTQVLMNALGVKEEPIVMSSLLNSPECIEIKKQGGLVNDKVVLELLLKKLSKPDYLCENEGLKKGVIIDGFPRSAKQVKFVELLYDKLCYIRKTINPNSSLPRFRISVLHVSEEESVKRQLSRGDFAIKENEVRKEKNLPLLEIRDTDVDPNASKKRYTLYQEQFKHLKSLEDKFDFDLIDANGTLKDVQNTIKTSYAKIQPQL